MKQFKWDKMKGIFLTFCILAFCILVMISAVNADIKVNQENKSILNNTASHYNMGIKAEVRLFFGLAPFEWNLSREEIEELKAMLNNLSPAAPIPIPDLRYVLITNENKSPYFPYYQIYVDYYYNTLIAIDNEGKERYYNATEVIEWLDALIYKHSPWPKLPPIPPNTPRIDFIQLDSFHPQAIVRQNTKLKMPGFGISSVGTAPLEGTISIPEFITLSRQNPEIDEEFPGLKVIMNKTSVIFSIPPHSEGVGFDIEVDTSKPREIIGEIIIKSNDKNMSEIKIPIHYIILPVDNVSDDKVIAQEVEKPDYTIYMIIGIILATILLSLFIIYYKKL